MITPFFFFSFPLALLLLLLLIPFLWGEFSLFQRRKKIAALFYPSLRENSALLFFTVAKVGGFALIWILLTFAAMWPVGNPHLATATSKSDASVKPHEIIFLVDTSASMGVRDGNNHETRLEEAKIIIENMIGELEGETASLYAFTSVLTPLVPPTLDYLFLRLITNDLALNEGGIGGTEFDPILETLKQKLSPGKAYSLFLFSDGGDNGVVKEIDWGGVDVHFYTIGIGSLTPSEIPNVLDGGRAVLSKLETTPLKALGGTFFSTNGLTLWELSSQLIEAMAKESLKNKENLSDKAVIDWKNQDLLFDPYFQMPLGIALFVYGLFLFPLKMARL